MRGLGGLFTRNLVYEATDTVTGETATYEIVTDVGGPGMYAAWAQGSYQGGMRIPGAWRAARLQAGILGAVPWHAYREVGGRPRRISPTPTLLDQPAPPDVRVTTFSSWHLDLLWHGNAVGLIAARDRRGWPTASVPVPARTVMVERVGPGQPNPDFPVGTIRYWIGGRWRHADDVIHVKGLCEPGALRGMGVLEEHLSGALKLSQELAKQAAGVADAAVPSVKIKSLDPDLTEADATKLKASYMKSQRTRQPAVIDANTEIEPLAWNPSETQLIEARKLSLLEIALIFGLDPSWLGAATSSRVYANIEQESINLLKFSLGEHFARFEQTLTAHMPRGTWAKANLDSILRADTLTRYQAHALALNRWLTDDEIRELEERAPLTPEQRATMAAAAPAPYTIPTRVGSES